jgi:pyruvate formate lyase activating enzyme
MLLESHNTGLADGVVPGRYWAPLDDGRIECRVCPRLCRLREGQRGMCFVRAREGDQVVLTSYGRSSGFCIDPIEKKPLNHFLPGTPILSFGTAGCNLACKFCFAPGTWIATTDGMRRIGDLFEACPDKVPFGEGRVGFPKGLEVWTRHAQRAAVAKVFARPYSGEMVALRAACCPPILATPNHGIFAAHRDDLDAIRKIPAGELTSDHYLVVPKRRVCNVDVSVSTREWLAKLELQPHAARPRRIATEQLGALLRMDGTSRQVGAALGYHPTYVRKLRAELARGALAAEREREVTLRPHGDGRLRFLAEKGPGIPPTLPLTTGFAWLLGIYCAEGAISSHRERPNSARLSFCFGRHEYELLTRTARLMTEVFDARPVIVNRRTTVTVECGQTSIARLFEALCGRGAANKQVPPPLLNASVEVMRAFIEGYLAGDGHRTATHAVGLTVSERLALGLFELGLHLGLLPTFFSHTPAATKVIEGRVVSQRKFYIVRYLRKRFDPGSDARPERSAWRETESSFLVPLRRIERVPYSGQVYNLEVEDDDHSYLAPFLAVANCQNWDISKSREVDKLADAASPEKLARVAKELGCSSIAFTYNDPVVFHEYAIDTAQACHELGLKAVSVTAGFQCAESRREMYRWMDAANVDLKGFTERFYYKVCGGHLQDVLDTLVYLKKETKVWFEITTLLIPGENDSEAEIEEETQWIMANLGPDVPLHFTAFHPDWKMLDKEPTPPATLTRSRAIALKNGLRYVYTGNVHDAEGGTTACSGCGARLVVRDWYRLLEWGLTDDGRCRACGTPCPGVFAGPPGQWGARRRPVTISAVA